MIQQNGKWLDIMNGMLHNTVYVDGELVAKEVKFTLPEITHKTVDVNAMGTLTVPLLGLIENMELSITKEGLDMKLFRSSTPVAKRIEIRWVQEKLCSDGVQSHVGCKAFMNAIPLNIPPINGEPASTPENELKFNVTRYELYIDGEEAIVVDRLAQVFKFDGEDFYPDIDQLL